MGRGLAGLTAAVAVLALAGQFAASAELLGHPGAGWVIWNMAGYFTVLTNALVAVTLLSAAAGARIADGLSGTIATGMVVTGAVYHSVLSGLWAPVGMAWWADQGLHTAVPVLTLIWWLVAVGKRNLTMQVAGFWLVWPLIYLVYAILRQAMTGFVAYPFLDLAGLGPARVAMNAVLVTALFVAVAGALLGLARFASGRAG
jgi:hypothetical protein